ncbi:MAG TPA: cyclic nucleotide-binding domain-containing protein [Hyphomicrobiaceae bacterium]|nr:cyclic nucleotide-binding domain-containing protein [Hyphomicrobiaceae bacterium]
MLDQTQIHDILNEIPLFAGCSAQVLDALGAVAEQREFKKGEVIYEAGEQALEMYVLLHGLVSFKTPSGVGHLFVETLMKRHMIFGWAALVPEHPRRLGSAACMETSTVLVMNGDRIMEILSGDPQAGFLVMKRLCSMIASTFIDKSKA